MCRAEAEIAADSPRSHIDSMKKPIMEPSTAPASAPPASFVAPAMGSMPITITYAEAKADQPEELSLEGLSLETSDPWENRVREAADADGESFVTIGPMPSKEELESMLLRIKEVAHTVACDCTVVHTQERQAADKEGSNNNSTKDGGPESEGEGPAVAHTASHAATHAVSHTAYLIVRKLPSQGHHLDLRVAVVGNVDAGKSTLVGVLTGPVSFLDDGRDRALSLTPSLVLIISVTLSLTLCLLLPHNTAPEQARPGAQPRAAAQARGRERPHLLHCGGAAHAPRRTRRQPRGRAAPEARRARRRRHRQGG